MQIDKSQILELLRSQGKNDEASQADGELPDQVDTDQHGGMLSKYGIDAGAQRAAPREWSGGPAAASGTGCPSAVAVASAAGSAACWAAADLPTTVGAR